MLGTDSQVPTRLEGLPASSVQTDALWEGLRVLSGGWLAWTELCPQSLGPEARGPAIPGCVG